MFWKNRDNSTHIPNISRTSPLDRARDSRIPVAAAAPRPPAFTQLASRWLKDEVFGAPLAAVLHPSPMRMKGLGLFILAGHPLFWLVWAMLLPQPYESLALRIAFALPGLFLLAGHVPNHPASRLAGQVFTAVAWLELPLFFSWMYLCNRGSPAWFAGMAAMILAYYAVTDWRIATLGIVAGALVAKVLFDFAGPSVPPMPRDQFWTHSIAFAACMALGLLLGLSSANLRREQLAQTLATVGIMAHELRTPLATMALIGDAVRGEGGTKLEQLAMRLHTLVRNINHQIDMQVTNARLTKLSARTETVSAENLVRTALANYPFRSTREKECVRLNVQRDFAFRGSAAMFTQVIDNLVKNALRSLAAKSTALQPADLAIEIGVQQARGRIVVADRGVGIPTEAQARIFEPFFSVNRGSGQGLGLAFCEEVVHAVRGSIRVRSAPGQGAVFTIELPVSRRG